MKLPDVNIWLALALSGHSRHPAARTWLAAFARCAGCERVTTDKASKPVQGAATSACKCREVIRRVILTTAELALVVGEERPIALHPVSRIIDACLRGDAGFGDHETVFAEAFGDEP